MFVLIKRILPLALIGTLFLFSCKNGTQQEAKASEGPQLPPPPKELLSRLYQQTDFIDYMFDDLTFSVSVGDEKSVKGNVGYLSEEAVPDLTCTKPIGNVYFQSKGEHMIIARSFYGNGCSYFVLKDKNNKPMYACQMSNAGKTFFNQIVNRTKATPTPPAPAGGQ